MALGGLRKNFDGEIVTRRSDLISYAHDASVFELLPAAVLAPANVADICNTVKFIASQKREFPELSITPRSAGTDMSGGAISQSMILDMTRHFKRIRSVSYDSVHAQPGVYYRDLEPKMLAKSAMLGCVPASRDLCTIGGMVANNSGGELSLRYGNTENFVRKLRIVLADGNEYEIAPMNRKQLAARVAKNDFLGRAYKKIYDLIEVNYDEIKSARPHVSKFSSGYNLWNVWDRDSGIFDPTHLFAGSQGTLGVITDIWLRLLPIEPVRCDGVFFLADTKNLAEIISEVLKYHPISFEGFDDITYNLAMQFPQSFESRVAKNDFPMLAASLAADRIKYADNPPKITLIVGLSGAKESVVNEHLRQLRKRLAGFGATSTDETEIDLAKYGLIRRASFNLLRQRISDEYASPFMDDVIVPPHTLPEFLPKLYRIIEKYKFPATVAGHFGDGNFHIIPLLPIAKKSIQDELRPALYEVASLVAEYGGAMSAEHNDGMVRGPILSKMFSQPVFAAFKQTKQIFDPQNIFNPHKKTDATWSFNAKHFRTSNGGELIK